MYLCVFQHGSKVFHHFFTVLNLFQHLSSKWNFFQLLSTKLQVCNFFLEISGCGIYGAWGTCISEVSVVLLSVTQCRVTTLKIQSPFFCVAAESSSFPSPSLLPSWFFPSPIYIYIYIYIHIYIYIIDYIYIDKKELIDYKIWSIKLVYAPLFSLITLMCI